MDSASSHIMTSWQKSSFSNDVPRRSLSQGFASSDQAGMTGNGPVDGHIANPPCPPDHRQSPRSGTHHHYNRYGHHIPTSHHRNPYGGSPQPSNAAPPSARQYDRYYEYAGYQLPTPPPPNCHGPTRQYSSIASEQKAPPLGNAFPTGSPSSIDSFRTGGCTCKKSRCLKLYCQCFALSTTCGPKCKCQTCFNTTLHADAIEDARRITLERNPNAFDDKFRGVPVTPSPYRGHVPPVAMYVHHSPPTTAWPRSSYRTPATMSAPVVSTPPAPRPPPRVNKFGCKCRRSFCLKKYCECYQNSVKCGLNCRCTNCRNYPHDGNGLPPPRPPPVVMPISYALASPRCISNDSFRGNDSIREQAPTVETKKSEDEDRMAIMAAVAMTELFGSKAELRDESLEKEDEITSPVCRPEIETEITTDTLRESYDMKTRLNEGLQKINNAPKTQTFHGVKRDLDAAVIISSPEKSEDEESIPPNKRTRNDQGPQADFSVSADPGRPESRNPSPVSVQNQQSAHARRIPFVVPQQQGPNHPFSVRTPYQIHHYPRTHRFGLPGYHQYYPPPPQHRVSSYEDVIKSSGLPKALSFRKICSKCGKTRGEHGELGFGNKCVFQDCGKCGAGEQIHMKAGSPMGILCRLTVEDGANPGAAKAYERKIRDLAARAELQKTLLEDKRERVERLAAQPPFLSTA